MSSGSIVGTSIEVTATFLIFISFGTMCAFFPRRHGAESGLLTADIGRKLSVLTTSLCLPFLSVTSLASTLERSHLGELWVLLAWGVCMVVVGAVLGGAAILIFRVPAQHQRLFFVAVAFPNITGMSLAILTALCGTPEFIAEENCVRRATAFVSLTSIGWSLVFWTLGCYLLRGDSKAGGWLIARDIIAGLLNPTMLGILVGLFLVLVPPLQHLFYGVDPPLAFLSRVMELLAAPSVSLMALLMGASLGHRFKKVSWATRFARPVAWVQRHVRRFRPARYTELAEGTADDAVLMDEVHPAAQHARRELADDDQRDLGADAPNELTVAVPEEDEAAAAVVTPIMSTRILAVLIFTRAVVAPMATFSLAYFGLAQYISGGNAKVAKMVLFAESMTPTANIVVVVAMQYGLGPACDAVALSVAIQLVVILPTLTGGLSLALKLVNN